MRLGILGRKIGMTQVFDKDGALIPVTVVDATNCHVTQVKSKDTDGYTAIQVAFGDRKPQNLSKPLSGHLKKASVAPKSYLSEIRFEQGADVTPFKNGQVLSAAMFAKGDRVDVSATTRGKGFTGVMKRYGYSGKHATHGTSKYFRHGGSNGTNTFPGKVLKNKGMPGQTGNWRNTTQNVEVFDVRKDEQILLLKGSVPGPRSGIVCIRSSNKHKAPQGRSWVTA